jgi:hypothetical protein
MGNNTRLPLTAPLTWSLNPETTSIDLMVGAYSKEEVDTAINSLQPALTSASPTNGYPLVDNGTIKGLVANSPLTLTWTADNLAMKFSSNLSLNNVCINRF